MSLRTKLIWPYLIVIVVTFVINQGYVYYTEHQSLQLKLVKEIRLFTHQLSHSIKDALVENDKQRVQSALDKLLTNKAIANVQLYDGERRLIVRSGKTLISDHPMSIANRKIVEPINHEGEVVAQLHITLVPQPIVMNYQQLLEEAAVFLALLIVSGVLLYVYIGRLVLKPLLRLNGTVQTLTHAHTNYDKIAHHSTDEVGELLYSFDKMMIKLLQREKQRQHSLEALQKKSKISEDVIDSIQYSLIITDTIGTIIFCNSATVAIFNKHSHGLQNSNICELFKTDASNELMQSLDKGIECNEVRLTSADNEQQYSLTSHFLSKHHYVLFEIRDITALEAAKSRERIAGRVFESSQDGLVVVNDKGIITMVNPAVTELLGVGSEQLVGRKCIDSIRSAELRKMYPDIIQSLNNYGIWQGEVVEQSPSGQSIPMFAKVNRIVKCERSELYDSVIVLTDLSDAKEMERLEYLTHHDPLTGLANRSKFNLVLDELIQRTAYVRDEFALFYLDLDGFKAVNDTYGHDAGDAVLQVVADRMTAVTRYSDLTARLAGDEFAMLINPANQAIVARVSEQLLDKISAPISYKGNMLNVGVSIGVKLVGLNERDADRVLKSADTAMYQAKKAGKGRSILMGYDS